MRIFNKENERRNIQWLFQKLHFERKIVEKNFNYFYFQWKITFKYHQEKNNKVLHPLKTKLFQHFCSKKPTQTKPIPKQSKPSNFKRLLNLDKKNY